MYGYLLMLVGAGLCPAQSPPPNKKSQMKKETVKTLINFLITVLTAIASAFCVQSCR